MISIAALTYSSMTVLKWVVSPSTTTMRFGKKTLFSLCCAHSVARLKLPASACSTTLTSLQLSPQTMLTP